MSEVTLDHEKAAKTEACNMAGVRRQLPVTVITRWAEIVGHDGFNLRFFPTYLPGKHGNLGASEELDTSDGSSRSNRNEENRLSEAEPGREPIDCILRHPIE